MTTREVEARAIMSSVVAGAVERLRKDIDAISGTASVNDLTEDRAPSLIATGLVCKPWAGAHFLIRISVEGQP